MSTPQKISIRPDQLFSEGDRQSFYQQFVIHFLAARDAMNYESNCAEGWVKHHIPVEDAEELAHWAWEEWKSVFGVRP